MSWCEWPRPIWTCLWRSEKVADSLQPSRIKFLVLSFQACFLAYFSFTTSPWTLSLSHPTFQHLAPLRQPTDGAADASSQPSHHPISARAAYEATTHASAVLLTMLPWPNSVARSCNRLEAQAFRRCVVNETPARCEGEKDYGIFFWKTYFLHKPLDRAMIVFLEASGKRKAIILLGWF